MQTFLTWLVVSSANPEKTSATIKGILIQYVSLLMAIFTVFNLPITNTQVYSYITDITAIIGGLLSLFGLGRKIYFMVKETIAESNLN